MAPPPYPGPGPRRSPRQFGPGPDRDPEDGLQPPLGEGQVEGHPGDGDQPQGHPPPTPSNGHKGEEGDGVEEGAVGGDGNDHPPPPPPPPPPNVQEGSLLGCVGSLLLKWEDQFNLLVQNIQGDLEDYWMKLSTPQ